VDRTDANASIVTEGWARDQGVPVASDILDSEIALALEVHGRIIREGPELQLEGVLNYPTIVDAKRDWHTKVAGQLIYDCLDKHAKGVRQQAHDKAAIASLKETLVELNREFAATVGSFGKLKTQQSNDAKVRTSRQAGPLLKEVQALKGANERLTVAKQEALTALGLRVKVITYLKAEVANLQNDKRELEKETAFQVDDVEGDWVSKADLIHGIEVEKERADFLQGEVEKLEAIESALPTAASVQSLKARNLAIVQAKTELEVQLRDLRVNLRARESDCGRLSR